MMHWTSGAALKIQYRFLMLILVVRENEVEQDRDYTRSQD